MNIIELARRGVQVISERRSIQTAQDYADYLISVMQIKPRSCFLWWKIERFDLDDLFKFPDGDNNLYFQTSRQIYAIHEPHCRRPDKHGYRYLENNIDLNS